MALFHEPNSTTPSDNNSGGPSPTRISVLRIDTADVTDESISSKKEEEHNPLLLSLYPISLSPRSVDRLGNTRTTPSLDTSYVKDCLTVMKRQEEQKSYKCTDYLGATKALHSTGHNRPVDEECRQRMCEWCYKVVDRFESPREVVAIAMSYLDRFLCTEEGQATLLDRKLYLLSAVTSLHIADKAHGFNIFKPSFLTDLSRGSYTEEDILFCEVEILKALQWKLSDPTSLGFVQHFMTFIPPDTVHKSVANTIEDCARFQTEIAVADYKLATVNSSYIAFAAILNSLECIDDTRLSPETKHEFVDSIEQFFSWMKLQKVKQIQSHLTLLLLNKVVPSNREKSDPLLSEEIEQETRVADQTLFHVS